MADVRARMRFAQSATRVAMDADLILNEADVLPLKEWSIIDDIFTIADSSSVSVANDDGENSGKFYVGQLVFIDESDPNVENGQWLRQFVGRVTAIRTYSDVQGGSNIMLSLMDLGWHLTSCDGQPLKRLEGKNFEQMLKLLVDSSWMLGTTVYKDNNKNKRLKNGRQVIERSFARLTNAKAIFPYIQVEIGQKPADIIKLYAQRDGVLLNVGVDGNMVFFQPDYLQPASYELHYHKPSDTRSRQNNCYGTPSVSETLDEVYSKVTCYSTKLLPAAADATANQENPNWAYTHTTYTPDVNPLPFVREHVFSDSEAINADMRRIRARWKWMLGMFNSWTYEVEFKGHSQVYGFGGASTQRGNFFGSDTMISMNDTINKVTGDYYVQSARRSCTLTGGLRTKLTIRKPFLLNPALNALPDPKQRGGGAKGTAKVKPRK